MLCCSEQCDRKNQCALFYRNPQPEYRKYDNVESLATHGWGSINFNGCKSHSDCGPLGDYKMFIPASEASNMSLKPIKSEDLIFSNALEDDRTNTYLYLFDYDWMQYTLTTRFKTEEMGVLNVKFEYFGATKSVMEVEQTFNGLVNTIVYEYSTDIFEKHIITFLQNHIRSWDSTYAFNGEQEVIDFFNDVIENGKVIKE